MIEKNFDFKRFGAISCGTYQEDAKGDPFVILLPPPNVTGSLHIGHSLCYTIQDIVARYRRLRGDNVLFQPGLDHAGIVTQLLVEKKLQAEGIKKEDIGREEFIEKIWQWKEESGGQILDQMKVLGISCDFSRLCFTMDEDRQKAVIKAFVELYRNNLIYRAQRLVNWDPVLKSAISDLEVVEKEEKGSLWHIRYDSVDSDDYLVVATTRPETLFGDTAVAVHPDDERYKHMVGKKVRLPLCDREIPVIADNYANPEKGTGAVKITPAHDFNDFDVGVRHCLSSINIFTKDGHLNEKVPAEFVGLDRFEVRKRVLSVLEDNGFLLETESIVHKVPYSDRSNTVIEPYLTDQWFVDAAKLAPRAMEAVYTGKTEFVPKHWENLYFEWLKNIRPWCISRQIWWGHRIPVWYGPDGAVFCCETEEDAYYEAYKYYKVRDINLRRDDDVLDTWFSSGLWAFATLGWPKDTEELSKFYSNAIVVTGFDIIFFWIARMMMLSTYFMDKPPFKKIYIHGLVRDEKGHKMSKSRGNVIDPLVLCDEYGADAVRYTLAYLSSPGRDIKMNKSLTEIGRNFLTKIWNAVRFAQMSGCVKDTGDLDISSVKNPIARWMIVELKIHLEVIERSFSNYRIDEVASTVYRLIWNSFCDWYIEFVKPILQSADGTEEKQEILRVTSWLLDKLVSILYPIAPFICTELHGELSEIKDISWPTIESIESFGTDCECVDILKEAISSIRSLRKQLNISPGAVVSVAIESSNVTTLKFLLKYEDVLQRMAKVELFYDSREGIPIVIGECIFRLSLPGDINVDAEVERFQAEISKIDKEVKSLTERLSNENFLQKANSDVVEDCKVRKDELIRNMSMLSDLVGKLSKWKMRKK